MFPDMYAYWDLLDTWRSFRSRINEIWDRLDRHRAKKGWQSLTSCSAAAMVDDGDRPEEKPRPPAGGKRSFQHKPGLVPILVALSSIAEWGEE